MRLGEVHLKPNILKSLLLFVSLTILIQFFYAVSTQTSFFSATQYLPVGYAIHLSYYLNELTRMQGLFFSMTVVSEVVKKL